MPDPAKYTDKNEFVSACISARHDENPKEDNDKSVAICIDIWNNKMAPKTVIRKTTAAKVGEDKEFILSDATVDRYGDIVSADGWILENFMKNPIALFNHNSDFPVGKW